MPIIFGFMVIILFVLVLGRPVDNVEDVYYDADYEEVEDAEEEEEIAVEETSVSDDSPIPTEEVSRSDEDEARDIAQDIFDDFLM